MQIPTQFQWPAKEDCICQSIPRLSISDNSINICVCIPSAEQKTSSYLETNLASVDRAATPNLKAVQQAESAVVINRPEGHEGQLVIATKSHVDWTLCIERTGTSKKLILMITVVLLTAIVLCVCSGNSAPAGAQPYWHSDEVCDYC